MTKKNATKNGVSELSTEGLGQVKAGNLGSNAYFEYLDRKFRPPIGRRAILFRWNG